MRDPRTTRAGTAGSSRMRAKSGTSPAMIRTRTRTSIRTPSPPKTTACRSLRKDMTLAPVPPRTSTPSIPGTSITPRTSIAMPLARGRAARSGDPGQRDDRGAAAGIRSPACATRGQSGSERAEASPHDHHSPRSSFHFTGSGRVGAVAGPFGHDDERRSNRRAGRAGRAGRSLGGAGPSPETLGPETGEPAYAESFRGGSASEFSVRDDARPAGSVPNRGPSKRRRGGQLRGPDLIATQRQ